MNKGFIEADVCVGCGAIVKASTVELQNKKRKLCRSCCSFRKVFKDMEIMAVARWKDDLAEARSYRAKGTVLLFKRASALRRVMDSEEFRSECRAGGESPEEVLDREVDDICCKFRVLMKVLSKYPTEHSWRTKNFADMVLEIINDTKVSDEVPRQRVDWKKQYIDLKAEFDKLQEHFNEIQNELSVLHSVQDAMATVSFHRM